MIKKCVVVPGIYCLHYSFLKELSQEWLTKNTFCSAAKLFMTISTSLVAPKMVITCDRTKAKMNVSKCAIGLVPGIWDLIEVNVSPDSENLDDDEYSLELASLQKIGANPVFLITSDGEKERMRKFAESKGYIVKILSQGDFELED